MSVDDAYTNLAVSQTATFKKLFAKTVNVKKLYEDGKIIDENKSVTKFFDTIYNPDLNMYFAKSTATDPCFVEKEVVFQDKQIIANIGSAYYFSGLPVFINTNSAIGIETTTEPNSAFFADYCNLPPTVISPIEGAGEFQTISEAIVDGRTLIILKAGTYNENLVLDANTTYQIIGSDGASVIEGRITGSGVTLYLSGIQFTGNFTLSSATIDISTNSNIYIENCTFTQTCQRGIRCDGTGNHYIVNCTFLNNSVTSLDMNNGNLYIWNCTSSSGVTCLNEESYVYNSTFASTSDIKSRIVYITESTFSLLSGPDNNRSPNLFMNQSNINGLIVGCTSFISACTLNGISISNGLLGTIVVFASNISNTIIIGTTDALSNIYFSSCIINATLNINSAVNSDISISNSEIILGAGTVNNNSLLTLSNCKISGSYAMTLGNSATLNVYNCLLYPVDPGGEGIFYNGGTNSILKFHQCTIYEILNCSLITSLYISECNFINTTNLVTTQNLSIDGTDCYITQSTFYSPNTSNTPPIKYNIFIRVTNTFTVRNCAIEILEGTNILIDTCTSGFIFNNSLVNRGVDITIPNLSEISGSGLFTSGNVRLGAGPATSGTFTSLPNIF